VRGSNPGAEFSMSSEGSTCVICLEPLVDGACTTSDKASEPIGVTVPCGHCLHVSCWEGWAASRLGSRDAKCPSCNQLASTFVRLFVDFGARGICGNDDDDSLSLSSCGTELASGMVEEQAKSIIPDEVECLDLTESDEDEAGVSASLSVAVDIEHQPVAVSVAQVSQSQSDREIFKAESRRRRAVSKTSDLGELDGRYKRIAKRLKRRVSLVEKQRTEMSRDARTLATRLLAKDEEINSVKKALNESEHRQQGVVRSLEGLHLERMQLARSLEESQREAAEAKLALRETEKLLRDKDEALREKQELFQRELSRNSATSMQEVQRMKEERPKLVNKIKSLQEQVHRLEGLHRMSSGRQSATAHVTQQQNSATTSHKATKKFLRAMNESRESERPVPCTANTDVDSLKLSAHAMRMRASIAKPRSRKAPPEALAVLDARDNIQPLEPIIPSFLMPQAKVRRTSDTNQNVLKLTKAPASSAGRVRHTSALQQKNLTFATSR
jgi:hypothetical protein